LRNFSADNQFQQAIKTPGKVFVTVAIPDNNFPTTSLVLTIANKRYFDDQITHIIHASFPVSVIDRHLKKKCK